MARIKSESKLRERVLAMLPEGIPAEAVVDVECDWDSYWVYLRTGYKAPATDSHTIHEWTLADLKKEVRRIYVVADDEGGYEG